jgi:hypothetical protein
MVEAMNGSATPGIGPLADADPHDAESAVNELEHLAKSNPDRYTHRLAWALGSWGDHLWDEGRHAEYLRAYEQAAHVVRVRVDAGIATRQEVSELPQHVGNVASVAFRVGRLDLARAAAEEAIMRESVLGAVPRPPQWDGAALVARMRAILAALT